MKLVNCILLPALLLFVNVSVTCAQAQTQTLQPTELKQLADGKKFVFKPKTANVEKSATTFGASFVNAGNANHVTLDGEYSLAFSTDSLLTYLPYFDNEIEDKPRGTAGSGGSVITNVNENGIKFSTARYEYAVKQRKTGKVVINIKPAENKLVETMVLEIELNGTAKLTLDLPNQANAISYNGTIQQSGTMN
ncbi:DUF4251 domain-containing protein [Mucilaginibacter sp. AW1-3]